MRSLLPSLCWLISTNGPKWSLQPLSLPDLLALGTPSLYLLIHFIQRESDWLSSLVKCQPLVQISRYEEGAHSAGTSTAAGAHPFGSGCGGKEPGRSEKGAQAGHATQAIFSTSM